MISTLLSTLFGKLVLGAAGVALATGGLGATGNLPDQMQQRTADVFSSIGIEIPNGGAEQPVLPEQAAEQAKSAVEADHAAKGKPTEMPSPAAKAEERQAPELPDEASEKAKTVTGKVFESDPADGRDFGAGVAATASGGASGSATNAPASGSDKAAEKSADGQSTAAEASGGASGSDHPTGKP
jgi:hypothetical protein